MTLFRIFPAFVVSLLLAAPIQAQIAVPNVFVPQTRILSADVNDNFTELGDKALNRLNGTMLGQLITQNLFPDGTGTRSLGTSGARWVNLFSVDGNFSSNVTVGGTLGVTGATTLAGLSATTGNFSSTLGVIGAATLGSVNSATSQPGFLAIAGFQVVGSGTDIVVLEEIYDTGGVFAANTMTAPVTGIYHLTGAITVVLCSASGIQLQLVTSNRSYALTSGPAQVGGAITIPVYADMDATDTAFLQTVNPDGASCALSGFFSGRLVP